MDTIESPVSKAGKLIVVDNVWTTCGAGAEIIARLTEKNICKDAVVHRMGFVFTTCPTTPTLEQYFYPNARKIASEAYGMVSSARESWFPSIELQMEEVEFKGPL